MSILDTLLTTDLTQALGILAVMAGAILLVTRLWSVSTNPAIKIGMIVMLFSVEMGAAFVLPYGIGAGARDVFGSIWTKTFGTFV